MTKPSIESWSEIRSRESKIHDCLKIAHLGPSIIALPLGRDSIDMLARSNGPDKPISKTLLSIFSNTGELDISPHSRSDDIFSDDSKS